MKLIIDIDDEQVLFDIKNRGLEAETETDKIIINALYNGILLSQPFDLEGLKNDMKALNCGNPYGLDYLLDCLDKRLGITITESNREESK